MKAHGGVELYLHSFLTSALDDASSFTSGEPPPPPSPSTRYIRGWMGPRADMDAVEKR
jgi:hypothetical protein